MFFRGDRIVNHLVTFVEESQLLLLMNECTIWQIIEDQKLLTNHSFKLLFIIKWSLRIQNGHIICNGASNSKNYRLHYGILCNLLKISLLQNRNPNKIKTKYKNHENVTCAWDVNIEASDHYFNAKIQTIKCKIFPKFGHILLTSIPILIQFHFEFTLYV